MNVAISTFVRRGYLFTALAVAVLLAGFSGTAWAQTTSASSYFANAAGTRRVSSGTLPEGANLGELDKPRPLKLTIKRPTRTKNDPYNGTGPHLKLGFDYNGTGAGVADSIVKITVDGTAQTTTTRGGTVNLTFTDSLEDRNEGTVDVPVDVDIAKDLIELIFEDTADPGDWLPEELVLTLTKGSGLGAAEGAGTVTNPYVRDFPTTKLKVTITDVDPKPQFRFSSRDIQLAKENIQTVTASVGVGAGGASPLPEGIKGTLNSLLTPNEDDVWLTVVPPDAVGRIIIIRSKSEGVEVDDRSDGTIIHPDAMGKYVIGRIMGAVPVVGGSKGIEFRIEAKAVSGFRDENVTLMLMDGRTAEKAKDDGGGIEPADAASVTVLSGEETPAVRFSKESVSIDEGESESIQLLASGMQGHEVGTVAVAVRGEALISLEQNGNPVSGSVSFGGNANAELTIIANSDPSLEDGEEKTATVTITDASGALIGDPGTVTVTVVGSTAVPVLPLFAQLLLALLLMVGGARLYRRRQG